MSPIQTSDPITDDGGECRIAELRAPERYKSPVAAPTRRKPRSLLAWRKRHHLDQRQAGEILGLSQSTYGRFELKKRFPKPEVAKRIQIITGLTLEIILGLD